MVEVCGGPVSHFDRQFSMIVKHMSFKIKQNLEPNPSSDTY